MSEQTQKLKKKIKRLKKKVESLTSQNSTHYSEVLRLHKLVNDFMSGKSSLSGHISLSIQKIGGSNE